MRIKHDSETLFDTQTAINMNSQLPHLVSHHKLSNSRSVGYRLYKGADIHYFKPFTISNRPKRGVWSYKPRPNVHLKMKEESDNVRLFMFH